MRRSPPTPNEDVGADRNDPIASGTPIARDTQPHGPGVLTKAASQPGRSASGQPVAGQKAASDRFDTKFAAATTASRNGPYATPTLIVGSMTPNGTRPVAQPIASAEPHRTTAKA